MQSACLVGPLLFGNRSTSPNAQQPRVSWINGKKEGEGWKELAPGFSSPFFSYGVHTWEEERWGKRALSSPPLLPPFPSQCGGKEENGLSERETGREGRREQHKMVLTDNPTPFP